MIPERFKPGVFTEDNEGNKEAHLLPGSFVPFVAFCRI
jgi:hypothetical protein